MAFLRIWLKYVKAASYGNSWLSMNERIRKQPKWAKTPSKLNLYRLSSTANTDNITENISKGYAGIIRKC